LSRIYAHKVTNLGTIFLRRSFEASKISRLLEMGTHSSRGLSNSKEEMMEGIGWTSK
jgi:hypothetical protein